MSNMHVLLDRHHADLLESLHLLLEDRLGFTCYVPQGMGWQEQGYWRFGQGYPDGGAGVARQFLVDAPERDELQPHRALRRITLEQAQAMSFDLVVASVPDNYSGYARFAQQRGARFAVEVGNVNQYVDHSLNPLILDSTGQYPGGIQFTPEFDMDGAFAFNPHLTPFGNPDKIVRGNVASFVNLFPRLPCYPLFQKTRVAYSKVSHWYTYGHDCDFFAKPTAYIGEVMGNYDWAWHDKITGDGFGYVIHYWASVGRPLIGHASHYRNQVASDLWEDGATCIDLDKHSPAETAHLMREIAADPELHQQMSFEIARRVRERIDFKADAERVADALGLAVPA